MNSGEPLVAGIDAGTTRIRTLVFTLSGDLVAEGFAPTPIEVTAESRSEFDPEALWQATISSIRNAVQRIGNPQRIRGIAAASVGESGIALDASCRAIARSLAWYDQSPLAVADALAKEFDTLALHQTCGMRLSSLAGLSKLLWLRGQDPAAFANIRFWLNVADYIAFRLSGVMATEFSLAGRMACQNLATGDWEPGLLAGVGISPSILPEIRENGAALGSVQKAVAQETGLPNDCIVSTGGHDHIIGALASGVFSSGAMLDSLGTAEALLLPIPEQSEDRRVVDWGLVQSMLCIGGQPLWYICGDLATSSASIEWFRSLFSDDIGYDDMMQGAERVEAGAEGVLFLPHLRIGSPPHRHPLPSGAFLNLSADTGRAVLYRAILEGLAFDTRNIRDHMIALLPKADQSKALSRPVTIIGGGSQNALLLKIKAAVFNNQLNVVQSREAVSLGAAMLAGLGSGQFRNLAEAISSMGIAVQEQRPEIGLSAAYDTMFRLKYRPAAAALRQLQN